MTIGSVQVSAWVAWLLAVVALCGFWAICYQAGTAIARGVDWWRDRRQPPDEDEEPDWIAEWSAGRLLDPLPPERTWEQMTSHQLPLTAAACSYCGFGVALADDGTQCKSGAACPFAGQLVRYVSLPPEAGAADHFLRPPGYLDAERERRAPWWEVQQRAAYESLGLEYPSGLLARVRGEL